MNAPQSKHPAYYYISTKAAFDPVKTLYVCAPAAAAASLEGVQQFAKSSGWQTLAEEAGAVLVLPLAPNGWANEPDELLLDLYQNTKNSFATRSGKAIWGRMGSLWCWETILYVTGYEEGAVFAGRTVTHYPNLFAAAALIGGAPSDFSAGQLPSNHWFIKTASADYQVKNCEIPVCVWLFSTNASDVQPAASYFAACNGAAGAQSAAVAGLPHQVYTGSNAAHQVRLFSGDYPAGPALANLLLHECFDHVIRWKNGPDGTLCLTESRKEFYSDPRFLRRTVHAGENDYDFFVHLPAGKTAADAKGLPLVFTGHGRGEPAWLFTTNNGWDLLADETGEFVVVSPDSPGNIWFWDRDKDAFEAMISACAAEFGIDTARVYLTGFSNGGMITGEAAVYRPSLFAAVSPWNAPSIDTLLMREKDINVSSTTVSPALDSAITAFATGKTGLPCYFIFGDNDPAASAGQSRLLQPFLQANHCAATVDAACPTGFAPAAVLTQQNAYAKQDGYTDPGRFTTYAYASASGVVRVCVSIMKNMPHGAIFDESRAVWSFLKQFRRDAAAPDVSIL